VNTVGSNSGDLGPPQHVGLGPNSVAPTVVNTVGSNSGDSGPPQHVGLGPNSVAPVVVNTVGSKSGDLGPPQHVGLGPNSVAPVVVNTVGSNSGVTSTSAQTRSSKNGKKRARASDYFNGDELSEEVARVTVTARNSHAPRSVLHQVSPPAVGAHQATTATITAAVIQSLTSLTTITSVKITSTIPATHKGGLTIN
jgi:hypothetical protein